MDLIERIESASGPDRELDALIAAALRCGAEEWAWADSYPAWEGRADGRVYLEEGGPSFKAPAYTASIDAAMTLVPDNSAITLSIYGKANAVKLVAPGCDCTAVAPTPALALCAASLRARGEA